MWRKTIFFMLLACAAQLRAADDYKLGPDSMPKAGVPHGRVEKFTFSDSKIFPGTRRDCWVYIPAEYDGATPAALMVFQDGGGYVSTNGQQRVPVVFDNLIAAKEMPVTIALFANPGTRGQGAGSSNRSFEYDSLGDAYARFLLEELIPFATRKFDLKISEDPNLHAICGSSSGGICAFTAAWERPGYFRKVLSQIGSFTNIRGGHNYPAYIRKTERKPIRVFLQDGSNDLNNLHGNWPLANQEMASALQFMGYDYKIVIGDGTHSGKHGGAILPESLRWLWRPETNPPQPLTKDNLKGDEALSKVLPNEGGWELAGEGYGFTDAACADAEGNFYFSDLPNGRIYRIGADGKPVVWLEHGPKISGLKPGPDGRFYAVTQGTVNGAKNEKKQIIAIDPASKEITVIASDVQPNDLAVSKAGWIYYTDTGKGEVARVPITAHNMGRTQTVAGGIDKPNGISLSADENFLVVSEYGGTNAWSYVVAPDGQINSGERFMTLRAPAGRRDSGGDGMTADSESRYYITSHLGIQMFDATGRMGGIILKPSDKACVSVAFAGPDHEWLYACASDKVFRRKTLVHGAALARK